MFQTNNLFDSARLPGPTASPHSRPNRAPANSSFSDCEPGSETPISPPSAFASGAPTPVRDAPPPLPSAPPPPLNSDLRSNNTQSDVDSDVLDSSRSELERIYVAAEKYLDDTVGDDDGDLDAAVIAAASIDAGDDDDHFLGDCYLGSSAQPRDGCGGGKGDVSVSPADTIKNEASPRSAGSTDSSGPAAGEYRRKKSLVRQERVVVNAAAGQGTCADDYDNDDDDDDKHVLNQVRYSTYFFFFFFFFFF